MVDFDTPRPGGKKAGLLLSIIAIILIGIAIGLALKPEIFSWESNRIIGTVSISPQDAVIGGAKWRVVSPWQDSGAFQEKGNFYLVEFKPVPGWETPAPIVLRKKMASSKIEGIYRETTFAEQLLFSLAGASTMAQRLVPELAELYLRHIGASEVRRVPGKEPDELMLQGIFYATQEIKTVTITGKGTESGLALLNAGSCDIAMASSRASLATAGTWAEELRTFPYSLQFLYLGVRKSQQIAPVRQ